MDKCFNTIFLFVIESLRVLLNVNRMESNNIIGLLFKLFFVLIIFIHGNSHFFILNSNI